MSVGRGKSFGGNTAASGAAPPPPCGLRVGLGHSRALRCAGGGARGLATEFTPATSTERDAVTMASRMRRDVWRTATKPESPSATCTAVDATREAFASGDCHCTAGGVVAVPLRRTTANASSTMSCATARILQKTMAALKPSKATSSSPSGPYRVLLGFLGHSFDFSCRLINPFREEHGFKI